MAINIQENSGSVTLEVRVIPRSSKSEIVGEYNGAMKVKLSAPPVDGAANEELIRVLSKEFEISRSAIEIVSGHTSKSKRVRIADVNPDRIADVLKAKS